MPEVGPEGEKDLSPVPKHSP